MELVQLNKDLTEVVMKTPANPDITWDKDFTTCAYQGNRLALDKLLALKKYEGSGTKGLKRFKLSADEWGLLEQLWPLLNVHFSVYPVYQLATDYYSVVLPSGY